MEFRDSQTYKNLLKALETEKNDSTTFHIYGNQATKEGYIQIGELFHQIANHKREHAVIWMKKLGNDNLGDTLTNLKKAAVKENHEWTTMYRDFALVAIEEGYTELAKLFEGMGLIEKHYDYRFSRLASNLESDSAFYKPRETVWICDNCGNIEWGQYAPKKCPICSCPQGFYHINCENF